MTALLVAVLLAAVLFAVGSRIGLPDRRRPDWALGGTAFLALWLLVETQVAAAWRFAPALAVALSICTAFASSVPRWLPRQGEGASRTTPGNAAERRLLLIVALALAIPLLRLPVPLDTDAQGFGHLALSVREGGDLTSLAPWRPGIAYLYSPGGLTLFATLSTLLPGIPMNDVMMGTAHAVTLLFVALAGTLGEELGRASRLPSDESGEPLRIEAWRRATQLSAAASIGLWTALLDSHYTAIIGLTMGLATVIACFRMWRTGAPVDMGLATVAFAALVATHQDSALALALGLVPLAISAVASAGRLDRYRIAAQTVMALGFAVLLLTPWLLRIVPLVAAGIESPFTRSPTHWRQMVLCHGVVWPALALAGMALGVYRRIPWAFGMLGWLVLLVDVSIVGGLESTFPRLTAPLTRFDYPFSLAWHGPLLPYLALGSFAIVEWASRRRLVLELFPGRRATLAAALLVLGSGIFARPLFGVVAGQLPVFGALSGHDDMRAMGWLRHEAPAGARVLNYPGDYSHLRDWEGHWAPAITERDCVYFRMQPFFLEKGPVGGQGGLDRATREQREMLSFWRDPADPANAARLSAAGIRYVLVPESVGDPGSLARAWRGRAPALLDGIRSRPSDAAYLRLVFRSGGAVVYELR